VPTPRPPPSTRPTSCGGRRRCGARPGRGPRPSRGPWASGRSFSDASPSAAVEISGFASALAALGGAIAGTSTGTDRFSGRISDATDGKAEVIFAAHSGGSALALRNAYRSSDLSPKLIGPNRLTESIDLTRLSALPKHVYTTGFYAPDLDNDRNRRFAADLPERARHRAELGHRGGL
jgi:hypothetical protein